MANIAQLSVRIGANISGLQRGVQDADRSLGNFSANTSKRFDEMKGRLDGFISGFAPLSLAAGGALGYGIKVFSDFEGVLAEIEARTGATAQEMEMLRGYALQMGADTAFSGQQAAEAMLQLMSSGANVEEAMAMLPAVLDAAAASGSDLGRTADSITDIMATFGLNANAIPENLQELINTLGITTDMFAQFGDSGEGSVPGITALARQLDVTESQVYEMWNATQQLTPEIERMASGLGITAAEWEAYGESIGNISPEIASLIDQTGIAGNRLAEMFTGASPAWFNSQLEDSTSVANSLARASASSSATMEDMMAAFVTGGSAAARYGLDVDRTNAILALFADRGKKSSEAGTQLSSMLQHMGLNTDRVMGAWRKLGTYMYDTEGNMRDFAVVIEEIKQGLAGMTTEEQNLVLQDLAGSYGVAGLTALTSGMSIAEMEARMNGASSASEVAQARMDTFAGRVDSLRGSIDGLITNALRPFMDNVLTPLVEDLTPVVNSISDWTTANPELTGTIIGVMATVAVMTPILWVASSAFGVMKSSIDGVTGTFKVLTGLFGTSAVPLLLFIGALSLADWPQIGTGIGQVADGFVKLWSGDPDAPRILGEGLKNIGEGLWQIPLTIADKVLELVGMDLGSAENNFAGFGVALENVGTLIVWKFDEASRMVEQMSLSVQSEMLALQAFWAQLSGDTEGAQRFDAEKARVDAQLAGYEVADAFTNSLNTGIFDGIDGIALDPSVMFRLTQDPESAAAGLSEQAKDILSLAIQNAVASGDMQFLVQIAPLLGTQTLQADSDFFTEAIQPARDALAGALDVAAWEAGTDPSWMMKLQSALETAGVPADFANWDTTALSNEVQSALITALNNSPDGVLTVDVPVGYVFNSETGEGSDVSIQQFLASMNLKALTEGATPQLRMTVEEMLSEAIATADAGVVEMLTPLAFALGIDVPGVQSQVSEQLNRALGGVRGAIAMNVAAEQSGNIIWYINPAYAPHGEGDGGRDDGSHRSGLNYVPFDGYRAELHQGEAVLTARQASAWRGGQGGTVINLHVSSYGESDYELARRLKRALEDGAR